MAQGKSKGNGKRKRQEKRAPYLQVNREGIEGVLAALSEHGSALWLLLHLLDERFRPGAPERLEVNLSALARDRGMQVRRLRRALSKLEDKGLCRRVGGHGKRQRIELTARALTISLPRFGPGRNGDNSAREGSPAPSNPDANVLETRTPTSGFPVELGRQRPTTRTPTSGFADIGTRARLETETQEETTKRSGGEAAGRGCRQAEVARIAAGLPQWQAAAMLELGRLPGLEHFNPGALYALAGLVDETRESASELVAILRDYRPHPPEGSKAILRAFAFVRACLLDRIERRVAHGQPEGSPLEPGQVRALYVEAFDVDGNRLGRAVEARSMDQRGVRALVAILDAKFLRARRRLEDGPPAGGSAIVRPASNETRDQRLAHA